VTRRGFISPNLLIGLAILAALVALLWGVRAYLSSVYEDGRERGVAETVAQYAKRDNQALRDAIAAKLTAEARVAATEIKAQATFALLAADYQKDVDNAEARNRDVLNDLRAGALRLRDPGATACAAVSAGGQGAATPGAATRSNDQAGGELSAQFAGFLLSEAARADAITLQLGACQAVIREDRRIVNGEP
jgi:hypothetical protein